LETGFLIDWSADGLSPIIQNIARGARNPEKESMEIIENLVSFGKRDDFPVDWSADWKKEGVPLMFQKSCYDNIAYDWSGDGLPVTFIDKGRNNYKLHPKKKEALENENPYIVDFSKNGMPRIPYVRNEMKIDWMSDGLPKQINVPFRQGWGEIDGVNPKTGRHIVKTTMINDWSQDGLPSQATNWKVKRCTSGLSTISTCDWSLTGLPHAIEKMLSKTSLTDFSCDWASDGLPILMKKAMACETDEPIMVVDWSEDWKGKLPQQLKWDVYDGQQLNWHEDGLPDVVNRNKRRIVEEDLIEKCDWSSDGLPFQAEKLGAEREEDIPNIIDSVDWSVKGIPNIGTFKSFWDELSLDWSTKGLPLGGSKYVHEPKYTLMLDWSAKGLPEQVRNIVAFDQDRLRSPFSPKNRRSSGLSEYQNFYADYSSTSNYLGAVHDNFSQTKNKTNSQWNRGKTKGRKRRGCTAILEGRRIGRQCESSNTTD
jgi:hypothetical protein